MVDDEFVNHGSEFSRNSKPDRETPAVASVSCPGDPVDKMPSMSCRFHYPAITLLILCLCGSPDVRAAASGMQVAIEKVERENDGKVLAVQTLERNKRKIYVIKVLTRDGRVKVVQVRATE